MIPTWNNSYSKLIQLNYCALYEKGLKSAKDGKDFIVNLPYSLTVSLGYAHTDKERKKRAAELLN